MRDPREDDEDAGEDPWSRPDLDDRCISCGKNRCVGLECDECIEHQYEYETEEVVSDA